MQEFLKELESIIEDWKKRYNKNRVASSQRLKTYETMIESKESSEAQQVRGLVGKVIEYDSLARQSKDIFTLLTIQILGVHVEILRLTVDNINIKLKQSGILEKAKDIGDIKKLKEKLEKTTKLLKELYEQGKQMEESYKKNKVFYIS